MKIGFCGAGGTGKTTLAKALAEATGLPLIPSPSRRCFERHGVKTEDDQRKLNPAQRWNLQYDIFKAIDEQVNNIKEGIFDRTHLDNLSYGIIQCREMIGEGDYSYMVKRTIEGHQTFDQVFYAPIYDWEQIDDGMRTQSFAQRHQHANLVLGFLANHGLMHGTLWDEPVQTRLGRMLPYIKDRMERERCQ